MNNYVLACYPTFQYDDCFEEVHLTNETKYSKEEFEKQCREAGTRDIFEITAFLKANYQYKDIEVHVLVDIREW